MSHTVKMREVGLVLSGRCDAAGLPQSHLTWPQIRSIARTFRSNYDAPQLFPDPRKWVVSAGHKVCKYRVDGLGGEVTGQDASGAYVVFYAPHADPRWQGWLITHGLCHLILCRYSRHYTESDVVMLAAELCAPWLLLRNLGAEVLAENSIYAPEWLPGVYYVAARRAA